MRLIRPRILLVDDETVIRKAFARALVQTFDVMQAPSGAAAVELLQVHEFDAVVTDLEMPDGSGDELVAWLVQHQPALATRVVVLTGGAKREDQAAWLRAFDAARVVAKPCSVGDLVRAIGRAIDGGEKT